MKNHYNIKNPANPFLNDGGPIYLWHISHSQIVTQSINREDDTTQSDGPVVNAVRREYRQAGMERFNLNASLRRNLLKKF